LIGAALALGLAGAMVPMSAQATGPVDFGGATILDQVDAVTPAQEQQIQQAIDTLRTDTGITLHVAYVDTFTGEADQAAWGRATNSANGFGDSDALLAVAVDGPAAPRRRGPGRASPSSSRKFQIQLRSERTGVGRRAELQPLPTQIRRAAPAAPADPPASRARIDSPQTPGPLPASPRPDSAGGGGAPPRFVPLQSVASPR
jgi:hypothetical protein